MAIHEFEPQVEPEVPNITLLREIADGQETVYHFYVNGEESSVTLAREDIVGDDSSYSYHLSFYGWEFASVDVKSWPELTVIESQGIVANLDDLGRIQAEKLLRESTPFVITSLETDFPAAYAIEGPEGSLL